MGTGATTVCSCVLSQKPGGMVREGMGHTDGRPWRAWEEEGRREVGRFWKVG